MICHKKEDKVQIAAVLTLSYVSLYYCTDGVGGKGRRKESMNMDSPSDRGTVRKETH